MALTAAELVAYLSLDKTSFDRALSASERDMRQTDSKFRSWAKDTSKAVATGITTAAVGVGALTASVMATGVAYNTLQQTSRAALSTLLGGTEAANAQMDKLDAFARNSPFAKDVFIRAQQQLIGFGMSAEDVVPTLGAIQDAVAAVGGSNEDIAEISNVLAKVTGTGKITAITLNELGIRGIDAATIIGEQMGKSGNEIRESITAGTLDADKAIEALTTGMSEKFGGAAANVKETMAGAADRIKAAWRDIGSTLATPFVDPNGGGKAAEWANEFADVLRAVERQAGPFTDMMVNRLGPSFGKVSLAMKDAKDSIDRFDMSDLERALDNLRPYAPVIAGISAAIVTMSTTSIPVLGGLSRALGPIPAAITAAALASPEMRDALMDLVRAAEPLLPALGDMIGLLAAGASEVFPIAAGALGIVTDVVGPLVDLFTALPQPIQTAALAFGALTIANQAFPGAAAGMQKAVSGITTGVTRMGEEMALQKSLQAGYVGSYQRLGDEMRTAGTRADGFRGNLIGVTGALGRTASAGIRGAASSLVGFLGGPWGVALTGATIAVSLWAKEQAEAKNRIQEIQSSLDEQTGALTENTRSVIAKQVQDSAYTKVMENVGVSLGQVTSAILDEGSAYDNTLDQMVRYYEEQGHSTEAAQQLAEGSGLIEYIDEQRDAFGDATDAAMEHADAMDEQEQQLSESYRSWERFNEALAVVSDDTQEMATRVQALNDALDELEGGTWSQEEAARELAASGRNLIDFFKDAAEKGDEFTGSLVDSETGMIANSEEGDRLHRMLKDLRGDMHEAAIAASDHAKETGNSAGAYDAAMEAMKPYRDELQNLQEQGYLTQDQVDALTESMFGIPEVTAFLITDEGEIGPLTQQVWDLTGAILATPDKTITIDEPESPKIIEGLEDLGFAVEHLPDGKIKLTTPNLNAVEDRIRELARERTAKVVVEYYADTSRLSKVQADNPGARIPSPYSPRYHGGIDLKGMADGGVMGVAEMVRPGQIRFAGDRSDVDEAWIPLDGSARSIAILTEAMRRMPGFDAEGMAAGGVDGGVAPTSVAPPQVEGVEAPDTSPLTGSWDDAMAQLVDSTVETFDAIESDTSSSMSATLAAVMAGNAGITSDTLANLSTQKRTTESEQRAMLGLTQSNLASMRGTTASELATMTAATQSNLSSMRGATSSEWSTMQGHTSQHMSTMRSLTSQGFAEMQDTGVSNMRGLRTGAVSQMAQAEPGFRDEVNSLIGVFGAFTDSVNTAYKDVGVNLDAPKRLYTGGVLSGYTPGRDIHQFTSPTGGNLHLSGGEAIMRPEFTRAVGEGWIDRANAAARQGGIEGVRNLLEPHPERFADGGVWRGLWAAVKGQFPGARLHSAYRPGAITATGNPSMHGLGKAIDITPSMDIANWIAANYGAATRELIFSPMGHRQLNRGKPHFYTGITRSMHWDHVHWAMDQALSGLAPYAGMGGGISPDFLTKAGIDFSGDFAKDYEAAARAHGDKILGKHLPQLPDSEVLEPLGSSVMESVVDNIIEQAREYGEMIASAGAGGGADQWAPVVMQALQIMGLPSSLAGTTLRRMMQESGGNPQAINLWDINARRGIPSKGLMQVIPPTFRAYAHPDHAGDIWDPLSNILASMRYAIARYGSLPKAYDRAGGYANGTEFATAGLHKVGENGEEWVNFRGGESVRTPQQMAHAGTAREQEINVTVTVPPEAVRSAMEGMQMTLMVDGQPMRAFVNTTVDAGIHDASRRLSRTSARR